MKKILMICALCFTIATHAYAEPCAGGHGEVIVGNDSKNYCKSKVIINWWSAHAWCAANGMALIDTNKHCTCTGHDNCNASVSCPNFYKVGTGDVWTATPNGSYNAYFVNLSSGTLNGTYQRYFYGHYALCTQP